VILAKELVMSNERDQWLKSIGLSYALLRIALGLNICLHGFVRWTVGLRSFAESLLPMFQKTLYPDGPSTPSAMCCLLSRLWWAPRCSLASKLGAL